VSGSHTYAEEGDYTTTVTLNVKPQQTATGTAHVADAPLTATAAAPATVALGSFDGPVATFTDADPAGTASDYTVTIDWGDGSAAAAGSAVANAGGGFDARGSHVYSTAGQRTVTATIADAGGASTTVSSTIDVTAGSGPAAATKPVILASLGNGGPPNVRLFGIQGNLRGSFFAFAPAFTGGVYVAAGDVNGDKTADIVTGSGAGTTAHVKVFDGKTGALLRQLDPFTSSFTGGVRVAVGDVNGDGTPDLIAGAGPGGGPAITAFDGKTGKQLLSFLAFDSSFRGGVYVAAGDVNGDGRADVIAGAGPGGGPVVKTFSGADNKLLGSFDAFDAAFTGGVRVAAGDVNGDGRADIVTGPGAGAITPNGPGPGGNQYNVNVFNGVQGKLLHSFFAFDALFSHGVSVAAGDVNGDGRADIIAGSGPSGTPRIRAIGGVGGSTLGAFEPFSPDLDDEVIVGVASGFLPAVQRFTISRHVFQVASFSTPRVAAAAAKRGTVFRFVMNGPGKARITIARKAGKRYRKVGSLVRRGHRGLNKVRFSGRIGRTALKPGRYRATITTSKRLAPKRVRFRIVKG
jgi:FG-GAP-like repeat/FG-GAP repeat